MNSVMIGRDVQRNLAIWRDAKFFFATLIFVTVIGQTYSAVWERAWQFHMKAVEPAPKVQASDGKRLPDELVSYCKEIHFSNPFCEIARKEHEKGLLHDNGTKISTSSYATSRHRDKPNDPFLMGPRRPLPEALAQSVYFQKPLTGYSPKGGPVYILQEEESLEDTTNRSSSYFKPGGFMPNEMPHSNHPRLQPSPPIHVPPAAHLQKEKVYQRQSTSTTYPTIRLPDSWMPRKATGALTNEAPSAMKTSLRTSTTKDNFYSVVQRDQQNFVVPETTTFPTHWSSTKNPQPSKIQWNNQFFQFQNAPEILRPVTVTEFYWSNTRNPHPFYTLGGNQYFTFPSRRRTPVTWSFTKSPLSIVTNYRHSYTTVSNDYQSFHVPTMYSIPSTTPVPFIFENGMERLQLQDGQMYLMVHYPSNDRHPPVKNNVLDDGMGFNDMLRVASEVHPLGLQIPTTQHQQFHWTQNADFEIPLPSTPLKCGTSPACSCLTSNGPLFSNAPVESATESYILDASEQRDTTREISQTHFPYRSTTTSKMGLASIVSVSPHQTQTRRWDYESPQISKEQPGNVWYLATDISYLEPVPDDNTSSEKRRYTTSSTVRSTITPPWGTKPWGLPQLTLPREPTLATTVVTNLEDWELPRIPQNPLDSWNTSSSHQPSGSSVQSFNPYRFPETPVQYDRGSLTTGDYGESLSDDEEIWSRSTQQPDEGSWNPDQAVRTAEVNLGNSNSGKTPERFTQSALTSYSLRGPEATMEISQSPGSFPGASSAQTSCSTRGSWNTNPNRATQTGSWISQQFFEGHSPNVENWKTSETLNSYSFQPLEGDPTGQWNHNNQPMVRVVPQISGNFVESWNPHQTLRNVIPASNAYGIPTDSSNPWNLQESFPLEISWSMPPITPISAQRTGLIYPMAYRYTQPKPQHHSMKFPTHSVPNVWSATRGSDLPTIPNVSDRRTNMSVPPIVLYYNQNHMDPPLLSNINEPFATVWPQKYQLSSATNMPTRSSQSAPDRGNPVKIFLDKYVDLKLVRPMYPVQIPLPPKDQETPFHSSQEEEEDMKRLLSMLIPK